MRVWRARGRSALRVAPPGRAVVSALAALLVPLAACSGRHGPREASPPGSTSGPAAAADTATPSLEPGDAVLLKIWREKEMSDTLQVDGNGRLTLPLLGTRQVGGIDADTLERRLLAEYREYLRTPAIEIKVLRRISILGAVKKPGLYPVDATFSLADALALAGGVTRSADRDDIRLVRDGTTVRQSLDWTRALATTPVRSGDRVVVGEKSFFARNWQWILGTVVSSSVILITR